MLAVCIVEANVIAATLMNHACLSTVQVLNYASLHVGLSTVAPGNGVSAAAAAVRTLRVAAQYIQYRKDRQAPKHVLQEQLVQPDKHLDREPVAGGHRAAGAIQPTMNELRVSMKNADNP